MIVVAPLTVNLIGGPHDGETIVMNPNPGVGPPQLLTYYANRRESDNATYVMDVYELWPPVPVWKEEAEAVEAHWQGVFNMNERTKPQ